MATKTKHRDDDLFKDSTMTFGEHLEELRACLFKSLLVMVLAFIVVLLFQWADKAVNFVQIPLTEALEKFYLKYSLKKADVKLRSLSDGGVQVPTADETSDVVNGDKLVPQVWYLDPRLVIRTLREFGFRVDETSAPELIQGDFIDFRGFCAAIVAKREVEGDPAHAVWRRLTPAGRQLVEEGAVSEKPTTDEERAERRRVQKQLAGEIDNRVLNDAAFYESSQPFYDGRIALRDRSRFDWSRLKDQVTGEYTAQTQRAERLEKIIAALPNADDEVRKGLNRQLLSLAYPTAVPVGPRKANMMPFLLFASISDDPRLNPKSLNVQEMFMVWIKAAIVLSIMIASPFVFYFLWSFVAAGLYPHEKGYVYIYLPFSLGLFLAGCALCFFYVLQYVLDFLFLFNDWMNVDPDMRISEWFSFALFLPLGFGIAFQLPLVMLFLERIGVMTVASYLAKWRISVMVIVVASAILTPADPYSMLLMAIPLVILYFLGIAMCRYLPQRRSPFDDEPAAA